MNELLLRYGCNPHQAPARIFAASGDLPLSVLNGSPGYINLLDALNSWQLVRELHSELGLFSAASFKHVSPAGAAVAVPLTRELKKAYMVEDVELSIAAVAYVRARGADRVSSFGDWAAFSGTVDKSAALVLKKEVSDGVIAPAYEPDALEILKAKKGGKYAVIQIDPQYEPSNHKELRDLFGICLEQKRNTVKLEHGTLSKIVTENKTLSDEAKRDLVLAQITLKYTQSNSVCFASGGQVIGVGAGQQSRIHCTRLAASKADRWFLRQHHNLLNLQFRENVKRPEKDNAIDQFLEDHLTPAEQYVWQSNFVSEPQRLSKDQKREWLNLMDNISVASDAFFPFRDNIDRAKLSGVKFIAQPGGSVRDDAVIEACNEYGMVMAFSGIRLFHH